MSQFGLVITDAGIALQNLIQAGDTLTFKRVAVGDGQLPEGGTKEGRTALVSEKDSVSPAYATLVNGMATVEAQFSNDGLGVAYTIREVGLFAQDPDDAEAEILYAYGNAGDNGDYMPAGEGADIITLVEKLVVAVGNASSVAAVLDESAAYVTQQQWSSHVGVGGLTQHPAVNGSTSGFMTPAMKAKLDAVNIAAYRRQYVTNSAADDPADFAAATGLGQVACIKGELVHGVPFNDWGGSVMFSINVTVAEAATVSIPVLFYDDNVYMFVDGVLVGSNTKPITWTAAAGDHLVQFIVNDSNSNAETLVIGEWMDSNVTFLSTPA